MRSLLRSAVLLTAIVALTPVMAADAPKIRVGVLKFGTVNWTLDVIQEKGLDSAEGVELEIVPLANKNATTVALQGGAVDMIVSDWIWVSRQRAEGNNYTFAPYSKAVGSVMVRPDAGIDTVADLADKRLGVAGGPVDKSWLLLRAYAQKEVGKDLTEMLKPNFAAPPLLNELMLKGDLDAALNFWHYAARLQAKGMRELISVAEILPALGIEGDMPLLGWVYKEDWANDNRQAVQGFLRAARQATTLMKEDSSLWSDFLRPATKAEDDETLAALREGFSAGVPEQFGEAEIGVAEQVFEILARLGGEKLVGKSTALAAGTFWDGYTF